MQAVLSVLSRSSMQCQLSVYLYQLVSTQRNSLSNSPCPPSLGRARLRGPIKSEPESACTPSNKQQIIPLFYPRDRGAPLRGIAPIATLERFIVYGLCKQIISGRAPGRGPEGTENCSSCQVGFLFQVRPTFISTAAAQAAYWKRPASSVIRVS